MPGSAGGLSFPCIGGDFRKLSAPLPRPFHYPPTLTHPTKPLPHPPTLPATQPLSRPLFPQTSLHAPTHTYSAPLATTLSTPLPFPAQPQPRPSPSTPTPSPTLTPSAQRELGFTRVQYPQLTRLRHPFPTRRPYPFPTRRPHPFPTRRPYPFPTRRPHPHSLPSAHRVRGFMRVQ